MLAFHTFATEEEGWELCEHCLIAFLPVIGRQGKEAGRQRIVENHWTQLVGSLCIIARRMKELGHEGSSIRVRELLDMATILELSDPEAQKRIYSHYRDFNPLLRLPADAA